jgi:hypothetical protein
MKFMKKQVCDELNRFGLYFEFNDSESDDSSKGDEIVIDSQNIGFCGTVDTVPGCKCE